MMSGANKLAKVLFIVTGVLLLSACAGGQPFKSGIEKRVNDRWELLLAENYAAAYEYLSPGVRSSITSNDYQRSMLLQRVRWTSAKFIRSECEGATCRVKVSIGYKVTGAVPGVKSFEGAHESMESWVQIDGVWYHVPDE